MNMDRINWLARHGDIWALWRERAGILFSEATDAEISEQMRKPAMPKVAGTVAVMPLSGVLTQKGDWWGTSMDSFGRAFDAAVASENIAGIVLDIDSPGGTVAGTQMLANRIYEARGKKPVVAVANSLAASAAFWIGTSAETFVVAPDGDVGSVGVFSMHQDVSKLMDDMGVKTTLVHSGRFKVEGHPFGPLDEEARMEMQKRCDAFYESFVETVARNRGVRTPSVKNGFGQGRVVNAKEAEAEKMVDGVMTIDEVLRKMVGTVRRSPAKASVLVEQELHAAYVGAFVGPGEDEEDDEDDTEVDDEARAARQAREKRVAELRASQREERLKEMEAV